MNGIMWHEIIGRVTRGLATADDAAAVSEHLGLDDIARMIKATGGDSDLARHLQVNLGVIRKRSLVRYGFREVRRAKM